MLPKHRECFDFPTVISKGQVDQQVEKRLFDGEFMHFQVW